MKKNAWLIPFALVCSLFFLWGLANSLNGSLVKQFQTALDLSRAQAGIVDTAFYLGYFVFALPAGYFMRRFGYKRAILFGLLLYAAGAFLFYPAAGVRQFGIFLLALFTIASGLAFLETAANLYATVLGDREGAAWRVNFAQIFNGMSIIIGPLIGSLLIFSSAENFTREQLVAMPHDQAESIRIAQALAVRTPYMLIGLLVGAVALLFWLTPMPERVHADTVPDVGTDRASLRDLLGRPRLMTGVLAQALNVGAQATLWSYFVDLKELFSPDVHVTAVEWLYPFEGKSARQIAGFHASFAMILFLLGRLVGSLLMRRIRAASVLVLFSAGAVVLALLAWYLGGGVAAVAAVMGIYFCQSIMFPTIFALATEGLSAKEGKLASSLVIMAIVGGAILPPLAGWLSHAEFRHMLLVPALCFVFVAYYGRSGARQSAL